MPYWWDRDMVGSWPVRFLTGSRWKSEMLGHMQFWTSVSQQTLYLLPTSRDEDKTWAEERKCLRDLHPRRAQGRGRVS